MKEIIVVIFLMISNSSIQDLCIIPDDGSQKPPSCNVSTLNQFCQDAGELQDNIVANFLKGTHWLNTTCEFRNVNNFVLKGHDGDEITIECSPLVETGFLFFNISNLQISDMEFIGCGSATKIQVFGFPQNIISTLLFANGSNLTLTNIAVTDAKAAGVYIYNVAENVTMDSCKIVNASSNGLDTISGNGFMYNHLTTKYTNICIMNSQFIKSGYSGEKDDCVNTYVVSYSSGLALFLGSSKLTLNIISTDFIQNTGCNGGNMAILFHSKSASVTISHTNFIGGHSNFGGGMYLTFLSSFLGLKYTYNFYLTKMRIVNSNFTSNVAEWYGGGLYVHWRHSLVANGTSLVDVTNTKFDGNSIGIDGGGGLAIHYKTFLHTNEDPNQFPKFNVNMNISNCSFYNHYLNKFLEQLPSESSVILAITVSYLGIDSIIVESNTCTAILAIGSTLVFYGSTRISNNTAVTGAGIRICSGSLMYFPPNTNLLITNNSAQETGGGVQVYLSSCFINIPMCFYQFTNAISQDYSLLKTVNFTITGNRAERGGDNIFGGSIDYCYFMWDNTSYHKRQFYVPNNTIGQPSSIASVPQQICMLDHYECTKTLNTAIYPGEQIMTFIRTVGQSFGAVKGTVLVSIKGDAIIRDREKLQAVIKSGQNVTYTVFSTQINVSTGIKFLNLQVDQPGDISDVHKIIRHQLPALINITFKDCPFGFTNGNSSLYPGRFGCRGSSNSVIVNSSIISQTITKRRNSWIGMFKVSDCSFLAISDYCPFDYCNSSFQQIKSQPQSLDQDEQCRYNRTGILCGSCPEGWSLGLGSSECHVKCSNVWLLLILPFVLAGLLLVLVIHFLNLTVTTGTVCGLIFYANIIQGYSPVLLSTEPIPGLTPILQIFLSWLNLDLGISTCFYEGMEAFGKTLLLFVFPIYIWLISAIVIILSHRYISFTRLIGRNALKVLSTLFLLSYSKMLRVIITALSVKTVRVYIDNASIPIVKIRWIVDGNIPYLDPKRHLIPFVAAILFIMLLLPFTLSLICIRHVYSLSNFCKVFSCIDKLKPFFDTYTGPFKDSARYWTGLLLFVRLFLLIIHTLDNINTVIPFYIIVAVCLILSANMILLKGVYKRHGLNVLEYFFILNICTIFLINTYYVDGPNLWKSISFHLLISSAFIVFLGILLYHTYLVFSNLPLMRRLSFSWSRNSEVNLLSFDEER